ncbi:uncharacterized protein KY384_001155 [Bacidia gigantensis]|uniref:uncharacterized protein n=1 Tax=Bacidia gigantensis TaxID=2732470 RepID=UPI001D04E051|nr:uncharacterized protein KY384_001155 [Bacidia gigantensis]KAG8534311.1 hypothetical protein KY384_001155 [Bacidia gigantensis]
MAPSTTTSYPSNWSRSICSSSDQSPEVALGPEQLSLYFLAVVQGLQIDLLPLVSQRALDLVGVGATASIRQLLVNIDASVAFKTMTWNLENEVENFHRLISEVLVLGHRSFHSHPNIIHLEGICWEPGQDGDVYPALVFEKTRYGDLWDFMFIGQTLQELHDGRVIHGDLKPQNVLIFQTESGDFVPKITDFGFAKPCTTESDLFFQLPHSGPWTAPEHHRRRFSSSQALSMEVYSFGVLCLWMLLYNTKCNKDVKFYNDMESLEDRSVNEHAYHLLNSSPEIDQESLHLLQIIFDSCLPKDPSNRAKSLAPAVTSLSPERVSRTDRVELEAAKPPFSRLSLSQLTQLDYRVRVRIFQLLGAQVSSVVEEDYSAVELEACYQLAWCYKLGFGTERNDNAFGSWLRKSRRSEESFDQELKDLKEIGATPLANVSIYSSHTKFSTWLEEGCALAINSAQYYREVGRIEEAETILTREHTDWQETLGLHHPMVFDRASMLATLMMELGRDKESVTLAEQTFDEASENTHAEFTRPTLALITLARAYVRYGQLEQAKPLQKRIVQANEIFYGETHLNTLQSKQILAVIHLMQNKLSKSAAMNESLLPHYSHTLGEDHGVTINTLLYLSRTYVFQNRFLKAEEITKLLIERAKRALGDRHEITLMARIQLSLILWSKREWFKLLGPRADGTLQYDIIDMAQELLGENHPFTLEVMWNTARNLFFKRQVEDAIVMTSTIVKRAKERTGSDAWETKFYQSKMDYILYWHKWESIGVRLMTFNFGRFVITSQHRPPPELRRLFGILYTRVPLPESEQAGMMYDRERNIDKSQQSVPSGSKGWRYWLPVTRLP